jgi:OOP family OmpA-OmpF porin
VKEAQPSLADQLAGENRTVSQEARGLIVSLPGILFDFDQATLRSETMSTLQQVADVLLQYPELEIRVEGHTDDQGSEEYNQDLSNRRALAVYDFLVGQGIAPAQIRHAGFGESLPVAPNDTAEGRQRNRRVDLVIPDAPQ